MDTLQIRQLLGQAYGLHQVDRDPHKAVALVSRALSDDDARAAARKLLSDLSTVVKARSRAPGECGCHVTAVSVNILSEALKEAA